MRDVVKMGCVGWHSIYWAKASAGPGSPNWPVRFGTIDHDSFGVDRLCILIIMLLSKYYRNRQTYIQSYSVRTSKWYSDG